MTPNEAKKDLADRLHRNGVTYQKLSAKTVSFEELGYGSTIFVTVHGTRWPAEPSVVTLVETIKAGIPKPSAGGYCIRYGITFAPDEIEEANP